MVLAENSDGELGSLERIVEARGAGKDVELLSFAATTSRSSTAEWSASSGPSRRHSSARVCCPHSATMSSLEGHRPPAVHEHGSPDRDDAAEAALYADFRKLPRPWVDTRVYAATPARFRELFATRIDLMRQDEIDGLGYTAPEHRLFEELMPESTRFMIVPRLRAEPRIEGFSGHGHDYAQAHPARAHPRPRGAQASCCPPCGSEPADSRDRAVRAARTGTARRRARDRSADRPSRRAA